ncbi:MAG: hypothetical protein GVY13_14840 [Alphaproteobacteria bacterium]|jgi:hypothetical protein|nr:hypothetical protein [Alphaproteobacteria bacterium]
MACAALLLLAAGCAGDGDPAAPAAGPEAATEAERPAAATADGRFDPEQAAALLARARQAEREARINDALDFYRRAGLAWPETLAAWEGLAALAERARRPEEARAARFMAERVRLYPGGDLFVQRDVARALRRYVEAGQAEPDANARQLAYAETLADYYEARYAERGRYQPLDPMFNLEPSEYPTAILTGLGGAIYVGTVVAGD